MPDLPEGERYERSADLNWARSSRFSSSIIQSALDAYIQRLPPPSQEGLEELSPLSRMQERLTHAMVLSLLGVF